MKKSKIIILGILILCIGLVFYFDLANYLSFENIKAQQAVLTDYVSQHPTQSIAIFFAIYVFCIALSIPGAALLTLLAGALFGLVKGLIIVSFASTIGATLAFIAARYLFKDSVQNRFGDKLAAINQGVEKEGAFYLFSLRLVPAVPFFLINLLMAITPIKTHVFYWVSQLGMLPGTAVYVNAGTQLASLESPKDILSPVIFGSFLALALLPWVMKKTLELFKKKRA